MTPLTTIVIPARNEQAHIGRTVASILEARSDIPFEIIVVDDGSTDGTSCGLDRLRRPAVRTPLTVLRTPGLGAARARNLGARHAQGDVLVFCDAHIFVPDGWLEELVPPIVSGEWTALSPGVAAHDRPDLAGFGQSMTAEGEIRWLPEPDRPTPVPFLPGACIAVPARVFLEGEGFDEGLRTWGWEDVEWSVRMWLSGGRLGVTPRTVVGHVFRSAHPYAVSLYDYHYNWVRTALSHFSGRRLEHLLKKIENHPMRFDLLRTALADGTLERRARLFASRQRDDEWFVREFRLPWGESPEDER